MKKLLLFMVVIMLLPALVFAGELSFKVKGDYTLPAAGWNSRGGITGSYDYIAAEKLITGGVIGSFGVDYWFGRSFALGVSAGAGFNELFYREYPLVTVPASLDMTLNFIHIQKVSFPLVLSLGAYGSVREKVVSFGGFAALSLGMDVRFTEHFSFGFETGVESHFEPAERFEDLSIQLNAVPVSMVMKFWV